MAKTRFSSTLLAGLALAGSSFLVATPVWAQRTRTSELGLGIGATNYRGEVSPQYQFQNNRPALTVFYRRDVSAPVTLRGGFTAGFLRATDTNVDGVDGNVPPLQDYRQISMKGGVAEVSAVVEYNFLDYHRRSDQHRVHATPYLFAGIAGYYASTTTESQNVALQPDFNRRGGRLGFAIPAGVGVKVALSEHFNVGAEVGARKAFTDQLDHLSDQDSLFVNSHDQDWYYYNGISVSYTFYKIHCPPPYHKNKGLLK
jgi:opacity protein-like surface antigen